MQLLFKPKFLDPIRRGEKTQTIRFWRSCSLAAGQRCAVPGVGGVQITAVDQVTVDELTDDDARREGFASADVLRKELRELYPDQSTGHRAYRIRFTLLPVQSRPGTP